MDTEIQCAINRRRPQGLIALLREDAPHYQGMSSNKLIRTRATILAAFASTGLPGRALPFILEELQNGRHPLAIAGAARGLRGRPKPYKPAVPYLLQALHNLDH